MKYKVGDKVRVRNDLVIDSVYDNGVWFRSNMARYKGQVVTISKVRDYFYEIKEDSNCWSWVDKMFEDIEFDDIFNCKKMYFSVGYETIYSGHQVIEKVVLINNPNIKNDKSKFVFLDENGNIFVLTLENIIYIIPYEHKNKKEGSNK